MWNLITTKTSDWNDNKDKDWHSRLSGRALVCPYGWQGFDSQAHQATCDVGFSPYNRADGFIVIGPATQRRNIFNYHVNMKIASPYPMRFCTREGIKAEKIKIIGILLCFQRLVMHKTSYCLFPLAMAARINDHEVSENNVVSPLWTDENCAFHEIWSMTLESHSSPPSSRWVFYHYVAGAEQNWTGL